MSVGAYEEPHSQGRLKTLKNKERPLGRDQEKVVPRSQSRNPPVRRVRLDLEGKVDDALERASGGVDEKLLKNSVGNSHMRPISDSNALFLLQ